MDDRVRGPLTEVAFLPAWAVIGVVTVGFLAGASVPLRYQWIPLVASVLVLGLPHGAVDHLALPRLYEASLSRRWIVTIVLLYAVLGGVYTVMWFVLPVAAFVLFILITWFHWGQGELYPLVELADAEHLNGGLIRILTIAVRGALPMVVPLIAFPDQYRLVAEELIGLYSQSATASLAVIFQPNTRLAVAAIVGSLIVGTLALGGIQAYKQQTLRPWFVDAGETALLVAFFLTVPPILAIGIYFCFWHALRHVVRLVALDERARTALRAGHPGTAAARFARDAAPLTIVSVLLLGGLYVLTPGSVDTLVALVALYLVLIAVLTLPHVVVVSWMDRVQGLLPWRIPE